MDTIFNTDGCFYRALDDEPIFVLLARDPCFAETIRGWETSRQALIGRGEKPQGDHPVLLEALATATAGVAWRNASTDPTNGYDAGQHARWHVEKAPERKLVEARPRKGAPPNGHMLPYDDWLTVLQTAMCLGNRFLLWEFDGELVFNENKNYRQSEGTPDWSGYYPVQHSLQKEMLWQALRDHKEARQHKVETVRRLIEAPTYANILRRANELGTEGCPSELLTKYLLTFADDVPVTFYAGDIRKALEALRRERDLAGRTKVFKYFENAEDEEGREITPMSITRISEMLDYATCYGEFDENTPNGTMASLSTEPMNDYRRHAIILYKRVLGVIPEGDNWATPAETVTGTSGVGKIDPAKEALWIDMAEERGFMSAEEAEKARAALPEGTKAAIPSKHLTFVVRDLAMKVATGLRQVSGDMDLTVKKNLVGQSERADDLRDEFGKIVDRINGYAAELEAGEVEAARFRSRPIKMHPALGMPYEAGWETGDPYKRFAETYAHEEMTVEDARAIVERFRKRFPDLLRIYDPTAPEVVPPGVYFGVEGGNFYDAKTNAGMGQRFWYDWRDRQDEFPQKIHDEVSIPKGYPHEWKLGGEGVRVISREWTAPSNSPFKQAMADPGRWTGRRINPAQYAKDAIEGIGKGFGKSYEEVAADFRRAAGITEEAPLTAHVNVEKAESDTLDVTDTPEMPPHRFTMFTKARGWAYGRGLEINPAHIPDMLDRMDKDGWHLQAVFGGVEPTKVGMLFKRVQMVVLNMEDYWRPSLPPSVAEMMAAPTEGVDDGPDMGRGLEP